MGKVATDACLDTMRRLADTVPDETLGAKAEREALADAIGEINKRKNIADYGLEFVINGYLSGTMTPIANAISIAVQNLLRPTVYAIGATTDALKITGGDRSLRDAYAMLQAATEGFTADLHYFRTGWLRGYPIDVPGTVREIAGATGRTVGEVKQSIGEALARRKALDDGVDPESDIFATRVAQAGEDAKRWKNDDPRINEYVHEGYDYIRKSIPGSGGEAVRIPTKLTVAIDEYGKARFRRQKVAQLASLKARKEANGDAQEYARLFEQYKREASVITNDFTEMQRTFGKVFGQNEDDMIPYTTIREFTLDNTFQSRLYGIPAQIQKLKNDSNPASRLILGTMVPFVKTPWNILKEGTTYVPGLPFAFRPTYSVEGVPVKMDNDELIPRQILGTSMFTAVMALYAADRVTGAPQSGEEAQAWRDQGKAAFAIKVGDTWIPYQRIEPIATVFGLAGDLARAVNEYEDDPNPDKKLYGELFTDLLVGLKHHIMAKSFMEGFSLVLEGLTDPARVDEQVATQLLRPLTPAIVNEAARLLDPLERQASTPFEKIQQRIPVAREMLPPEYGLIGGPRETNAIQAITGFGIISESDRSPLQQELSQLNFTKGRVGDKIKGVDLDNNQLARYRQMTAEALTPVLERLIQSDSYQKLSDARKKVILEDVTNQIKGKVRSRYYLELNRDDPEMAKKFRNVFLIKEGVPERIAQ